MTTPRIIAAQQIEKKLATELKKHVTLNKKMTERYQESRYDTDLEDMILTATMSCDVQITLDGNDCLEQVEEADLDGADDIFLSAAQQIITNIVDDLGSDVEVRMDYSSYDAQVKTSFTEQENIKIDECVLKGSTRRRRR